MKGMHWVWVAALLMGLGIVAFTNFVSEKEEARPVFATEEATQPLQTNAQ